MMPLMGVRISWLMFARNSDLARLAASAPDFASLSCSMAAFIRASACLRSEMSRMMLDE